MIDLHSHILPGIDDGAPDLAAATEMAELAVADGITTMACTPHISPGVYENDAASIEASVASLSQQLRRSGISLTLVTGADVHVTPDLLEKLQSGAIPTLNGSRYFLLELPHSLAPKWVEELADRILKSEFVPIITHPERSSWIAANFSIIDRLNRAGCLMQITAGALLGDFGRRAKFYAERLVAEDYVDVVASDAHDVKRRPPTLDIARRWLAGRVGEDRAMDMVLHRPAAILADRPLLRARPLPPRARGSFDRAVHHLSRIVNL